jgi:hypothetical protein
LNVFCVAGVEASINANEHVNVEWHRYHRLS